LALWSIIAAAPSLLLGQNTGTVLGTVKDQTGAVLPGASITIRNVETGISRTTVSGGRGEYRVPALNVGTYEVQAAMTGFQTGVRQGITLTVGREAVVDFSLSVGSVAEQVTVTGEAPLIETTTATVGGVVDQQQMRDIPLNARSFLELVPLQAGAVLSETGGESAVFGFGKKLSVVGTRYTANSFLLDGADINDASGTSGSAAGTMAGVETVREFRVITNAYDAEYGRHTGGVVSAVTKSGTNNFHGSLFEFLRNDNFDAPKWEDNSQGGGVKPEFRRNQFGGSLGGPIITDRTFFFGSYEGLREGLGETATRNVPGESVRAGIIPRTTTVGGQQVTTLHEIGIHPAVRPYLESWPRANIPCGERCLGGQYQFDRNDGTAQYGEATNRITNQNFWTGRVDHNISDSDLIFVRFQKDDAKRRSPSMNVDLVSSTGTRFTTIEETHIYSPALLGKTHLSFNRTTFGDVNEKRPGYTFPVDAFTPADVVIGSISVTGLTGWGGGTLTPRNNSQNLWQFKEEMVWSSGIHSTKFGLQFTRFQFNQRGDFFGGGQFNFGNTSVPDVTGTITGLEGFMRNTPTAATFTSPGSDSHRSWAQQLWGFYFQDDIRLRPGLSLNAGLRYEFITVPKERYGRSATIRDLRDAHLNTVTPDTTDVGPLFKNPSLKNFAPRVGFAWDVFGTGKTSLRGGIGIFHEQLLSIMWLVPGNRTSPFYSVAELFRAAFNERGLEINFPNAFTAQSDLLTTFAGKPQIDGIEYEISQPAVYKYSFDIDQQLASDTTLALGYTGTRGTHLMRGNLQLNTSLSCISGSTCPAGVPDLGGRRYYLITSDPDRNNPNFNRFRWRITDGTSDYHGLRTSLTKRFSQGFQLQTSYTWSRAIDDGSAFLGSGDFTNDRQPYRALKERALSSFDVRHSFYTNFVYDLPGSNLASAPGKILGGWSLSGILRLSSGSPNSVTASVPTFQPQPNTGEVSRSLTYVDGPSVDMIPGGDMKSVNSQNPDNYFDVNQYSWPFNNCLRPTATAAFPCAARDANGLRLAPGIFAGNVGPGTLIGPGVANLDLTLTKTTAIPQLGEAGNLEFRFELFNVFNRPNFGDPSTGIFSATGALNPGAGTINSTRTSSRQIQFALRLGF
jgi:hypothetical protein